MTEFTSHLRIEGVQGSLLDMTRSATVTEGGVHGCSVDGIGQVNR